MRTILNNAKLFQPFERELKSVTIVLEGNRVAAVAPANEQLSVNSEDRVIDLQGMTVMPGMTIGHWHPDYPNFGLDELDTI